MSDDLSGVDPSVNDLNQPVGEVRELHIINCNDYTDALRSALREALQRQKAGYTLRNLNSTVAHCFAEALTESEKAMEAAHYLSYVLTDPVPTVIYTHARRWYNPLSWFWPQRFGREERHAYLLLTAGITVVEDLGDVVLHGYEDRVSVSVEFD